MNILVPLILALVIMAAAIAYTGDWLGSLVGKRRLSLFGVRPKQTGRIIGVLAGVAIMLVTVGTLALVFRNAVRVIFNAQAVAEQLQVAEAQTRNLESQRDALSGELQAARDTIASAQGETQRALVQRDEAERELGELQRQQTTLQQSLGILQRDIADLEVQVEAAQRGLLDAEREREVAQGQLEDTQARLSALQQELTGLQARAAELTQQNEALTSSNDELLESNVRLVEANDSLRTDITAKNQQLALLATEVNTLLQDLDDSALALQEAEYRLAAMDSGDLTYSLNELVGSGLLRGQDAPAIHDELAQLLAQANENTARRRAGRVELVPAQLESLLSEALETPGEDLVTLRSAANHFGTEAIRVVIESSENRQLVGAGQLVISRQIHLGSRQLPAEREQVRVTLLRLQREARDRLLAMGLSDAVSPALGPDSLEVDGFANQLLRLHGPVTIGLSASASIRSSGPATLEFVIVN